MIDSQLVSIHKRYLSAQAGVLLACEILDVDPLYQRVQNRRGFSLNHNVPFLDEHQLYSGALEKR